MKLPIPSFLLRNRRAAGGFTFLEVLVALAIAMTFLAALYTSFIQMLRTWDEMSARMEALRNARTAMMTISDEIKSVSAVISSATPTLIGVNNTAPYGDGIDNDRDGRVDEEVLNGLDDDNDWSAATDDLHAKIGTVNLLYDRFEYTAQPPFNVLYGVAQSDLGDFHVDEDVKFGRDSMVFRITPIVPVPDMLFRTITYTLGTFDGQNNVLIRQARTEFTAASGRLPVVSTAPLAFDCLGLDFLYWNPNANPNPGTPRADRPYWVETWDSTAAPTFNPPQLPLPASIYMRVTMYADTAPDQNYVGGKPVKTLIMQTTVDIEQTIGDALYPRANI